MPAPRKMERDATFNALRKTADSFNETNDCAVIAVCAVTGESYDKVRALMFKHGRVARKGTYFSTTDAVLRELGYRAVVVPQHHFLSQYPQRRSGPPVARCVTTHHPDRFNDVWADGNSYLLRCNRHILAVVNGVNMDWSRGKSMRAKYVYRVEKVN